MYTIYHIPGKKIGVTRNLNSRVTKQQGYKPGEYEVLFSTDDISEISQKEIELQKSYGYKVDRQSYKNLITKNKKMNINATEQTSTFPVPLNKLKGQLMDNLDLVWATSHGNFKITKEVIPWLMKNARTSMFNDNRCYVYNKAFDEAINTKAKKKKKSNGDGDDGATEMHTEATAKSADGLTLPDADQIAAFREEHQIKVIEGTPDPIIEFAHAPFPKKLIAALLKQGYKTPSPIQAQAWPIALQGKDIVAVAKTGSGKTCGFLLPALCRIVKNGPCAAPEMEMVDGRFRPAAVTPSAIVLAPTRELAIQIGEECGKFCPAAGAKVVTLYGGASKGDQLRALRTGADVVVATPGRLNDLRHIIYKSADMPWRRARTNLGLMMREELLKENIDGEALLWAHNRIVGRSEDRKILMVISDGLPVDNSTLLVNPSNYLEQHLKYAIDQIENQSSVELVAIGIGHDVTHHYHRAVTITDAEQLGDAMTEQLVDLFDEESNKKNRPVATDVT